MTALPPLRRARLALAYIVGVAAVALFVGSTATSLRGGAPARPSGSELDALERLVAAYPAALQRVEGMDLVWRDGTRMPVSDGGAAKSFEQMLRAPDIVDMFAIAYPHGPLSDNPKANSDPGRFRNTAFFNKMYGDCRRGEVAPELVDIVWLPRTSGKRIKVTARNGVADKLKAVVRELDALPDRFTRFLVPVAGTFNCRVIAGTNRLSAHSYGIAIDISVKHANYWRWSKQGARAYRNSVPYEIVEIFEKHGFIWGGKWYHFDTMHFEYRPELLTGTGGGGVP